jgi:hypothetical protein
VGKQSGFAAIAVCKKVCARRLRTLPEKKKEKEPPEVNQSYLRLFLGSKIGKYTSGPQPFFQTAIKPSTSGDIHLL